MHNMNKHEVLLGGGGGGGYIFPSSEFQKLSILCIEEEAMLPSVFYKCCICAFLCHCLSFNSSLCCLSPFLSVPDKRQVSGQ